MGCRLRATSLQQPVPSNQSLVIHRYPKASCVVPEVIVVDAEIQTSTGPHPNRALVVADEEVLSALADAADERCRRPARDRAAVITRRVRFALGTVLTIRSPAHAASRAEIQHLAGADVDARVLPRRPRIDAHVAFAQPRRPAAAGIVALTIAVAITISIAIEAIAGTIGVAIELDAYDVIPIEPQAFAAAERPPLPVELDHLVAHADERAFDAPSVAQHERIGAKRHRPGGHTQSNDHRPATGD